MYEKQYIYNKCKHNKQSKNVNFLIQSNRNGSRYSFKKRKSTKKSHKLYIIKMKKFPRYLKRRKFQTQIGFSINVQ